MTRRSWIQNPNPPYDLIPAEEYRPPEEKGRLYVIPDYPDFVSPIDGKVVKGRKGYREHCKEHNVTNASDYSQEWKDNAKRRKELFTSKKAKQERIEALKEAYERHRR